MLTILKAIDRKSIIPPNIWSLKTCTKEGFLSNLLSWNVLMFRALSLKRITRVLFVYSGVVARHNKSMKIDFPLTLMVYHRKISTFIKKQNALANWASKCPQHLSKAQFS